MARAYTEVVIDVGALTGTASFSPPAGKRLVVRDVSTFALTTGTHSALTVSSRGSGAVFYYHDTAPGIAESSQWEGRQAIDDGDTLDVAVIGSQRDVRVTGYLLDT